MVGTRLLTAADVERASRELAVAFAEDPFMTWIFRDPPTRAERLGLMTALTVRRGLQLGWTHLLVGGGGVAVWSPPDVALYDDETGAAIGAAIALDPGWGDVVGGAFERLGTHRPDTAHFYLGWLGVVPERRGGGAGATLLRRTLEVCDAEGHVAHLVSSNPRNIGLYERHGFEAVASIEVDDRGPIVTPMTRQPGGGA